MEDSLEMYCKGMLQVMKSHYGLFKTQTTAIDNILNRIVNGINNIRINKVVMKISALLVYNTQSYMEMTNNIVIGNLNLLFRLQKLVSPYQQETEEIDFGYKKQEGKTPLY